MKNLTMISLIVFGFIFQSLSQENSTSDTNDLKAVIIEGVRATEKTPVTQQTLEAKEIESLYHTQELPLLLSNTPNVVSSTDGGHNLGYTYFRLRGIDQTRINMTLEGVPLNEPEDQGVYFSNYPDFTNSIRSMQIQRGVGTSSNGVSSYAGSISFESPNGQEKFTELQTGFGSWNTHRVSFENSTGMMKNNTSFYSRFSTFGTDGYKYNSGSEGYSFFLSGGYFGSKNLLKVTAFSGRSFNQMAWFAVSEDDIKVDPRTNYNTNRESDDFMQSMILLKYKRYFKNSSLTITPFYNRLDGNWGLDLVPLGAGTDVLNFKLSSNFYGVVSNYNIKKNDYEINFGVNGNTYERRHAMDIPPSTENLYSNVGNKDEVSSYLKVSYDINNFTLFVDGQYRCVTFRYDGSMDMPTFEWSFFNPKGGVTYTLSENVNLYTSVGQAYREPTRTDIFMGEDDPVVYSTVDPEFVTDFELGTNVNYENLNLQANVYYMDFENEITLLGALGSNGLPLMTNVDNSFRSGVELDANLILLSDNDIKVQLTNSSAYSYNRITDSGRDFQPLYTPNLIVNQGVFLVHDKFRIGAYIKYHSESYIDWENTLTTPSFIVLNGQIDWSFYKQHSFSVRINNITNEQYFTNGYAVGTDRYFFVNPPMNLFATLKLRI